MASFDVSLLQISVSGIITAENANVTRMPEARYDHCVIGYDNKAAFIIGGRTTDGSMLTNCYMFMISVAHFVKVFSLSRPRLNPICGIVGSKIIIAGGYKEESIKS